MKPRPDKSQKLASERIVSGVAGDGPFWKYRFENVIFGELKKAVPGKIGIAGWRSKVSGLDARKLHSPDRKRLTVPRGVVDECKLADLNEYAVACLSRDWVAWVLFFIPLRGQAGRTMYSDEQASPAFPVRPGENPRLYPPFEWRGKGRDFMIPPCILFPELFFWKEKVAFGQTSGSNYSVEIPEALRVSTIERPQPHTRGERTAFAMAYDAIGNLILFRQPLDFFSKV